MGPTLGARVPYSWGKRPHRASVYSLRAAVGSAVTGAAFGAGAALIFALVEHGHDGLRVELGDDDCDQNQDAADALA